VPAPPQLCLFARRARRIPGNVIRSFPELIPISRRGHACGIARGARLRAFTGGDPGKIHHLERDPEFLIELPKEVQVLRLLTSHGITGRG
jgi:hypothetical protein